LLHRPARFTRKSLRHHEDESFSNPLIFPGEGLPGGRPVRRLGLHLMDESAVQVVMTEVRNCALVMLESATYIQSELANVRMTDALRGETNELCTALVSTKHDVISELFALDELLGSEASASVIGSRVNHIVHWFRDDITRMHQLVIALESASKQDPECVSAYILVAESATNILHAFGRTRAAAAALGAEVDTR
jgi:hypothetical protein